jgi:hypothetical protein
MNIDHAVPAFQPETAYRIFMQTIIGSSVRQTAAALCQSK